MSKIDQSFEKEEHLGESALFKDWLLDEKNQQKNKPPEKAKKQTRISVKDDPIYRETLNKFRLSAIQGDLVEFCSLCQKNADFLKTYSSFLSPLKETLVDPLFFKEDIASTFVSFLSTENQRDFYYLILEKTPPEKRQNITLDILQNTPPSAELVAKILKNSNEKIFEDVCKRGLLKKYQKDLDLVGLFKMISDKNSVRMFEMLSEEISEKTAVFSWKECLLNDRFFLDNVSKKVDFVFRVAASQKASKIHKKVLKKGLLTELVLPHHQSRFALGYTSSNLNSHILLSNTSFLLALLADQEGKVLLKKYLKNADVNDPLSFILALSLLASREKNPSMLLKFLKLDKSWSTVKDPHGNNFFHFLLSDDDVVGSDSFLPMVRLAPHLLSLSNDEKQKPLDFVSEETRASISKDDLKKSLTPSFSKSFSPAPKKM